jgi:hypothetical protein
MTKKLVVSPVSVIVNGRVGVSGQICGREMLRPLIKQVVEQFSNMMNVFL